MKSKVEMSFKYFTLLMLSLCMLLSIMSCSDDKDEEQTITHLMQVDGSVNGEKVSIKEDLDYELGITKSSKFTFCLDSDKVTEAFIWTAKLKDTPDTTITLYLRLNNITQNRGAVIKSPSLGPDTLLNPKNICYVIVRDVKTDSVERYFTYLNWLYAHWQFFMVRRAQRIVKKYGYTREYLNLPGDYAGIEGYLIGTLFNQRDRNKKLNININYTIF